MGTKRDVPTPEERIAVILSALKAIRAGVPAKKAWGDAALKGGVAESSAYKWYSMVEGHPRNEWPSILASQYGKRAGQYSYAEEVYEAFKNEYLSMAVPSMVGAYQVLAQVAAKKGWVVPSLRVLQRRMKVDSSVRKRTRYDEVDLGA